jgi:hypothetical protein
LKEKSDEITDINGNIYEKMEEMPGQKKPAFLFSSSYRTHKKAGK